jgi:secondary thiamine-phosphate synthase enzyme
VTKMAVYGAKFVIGTKAENDIIDITGQVEKILAGSKMKDGIANVFVAGSTGAITTIEYEPGLIEDLPVALERIAPSDARYAHHERWHDGNGHSHVRASLLGPGITLPFRNKKLVLGTWQQIVFMEMDVRPREREIHVQLVGE